jgi:hypothetical protein
MSAISLGKVAGQGQRQPEPGSLKERQRFSLDQKNGRLYILV